MADIRVIDTGYLTVDTSGVSQLPDSERANSGNPIILKGVSINYSRDVNADKSAIPSNYTGAEINIVSVSNPQITIKGVLDKNSSSDLNTIIYLDQLVRFPGIKLLYYDNNDGVVALLNKLGEENQDDVHKDLFFSGVSVPHLHVLFLNITFVEVSTNIIQFTLSGQVTY